MIGNLSGATLQASTTAVDYDDLVLKPVNYVSANQSSGLHIFQFDHAEDKPCTF